MVSPLQTTLSPQIERSASLNCDSEIKPDLPRTPSIPERTPATYNARAAWFPSAGRQCGGMKPVLRLGPRWLPSALEYGSANVEVQRNSGRFNAQPKSDMLPSRHQYALVKGDAVQTIEQYLETNSETIVALAYFNMGIYQPTVKTLEALNKVVTNGSVIGFDELNSGIFRRNSRAKGRPGSR